MHAVGAIGPVLLCYDGSAHASRAVRSAGALLRPRRAFVIHVAETPASGEVAEGRRVALEEGFAPVAIVEANRGPVASVILEEARARGASVIVVGARGRTPAQPAVLGSVTGALLRESDVPLLVVGPRVPPSPASEPLFMCYDGSRIAREAVATAGDLLAGRAAIVASFIPAVDDSVVLRSALPWPAGVEAQDRLARLDRQEAEAPGRRAAEGADAAAAAGFAARPLGISAASASDEEQEEPWRRLLRAAERDEAACIVVGHHAFAQHPGGTAHGLIHHAERPVLVVPGSEGRGGRASRSVGDSRKPRDDASSSGGAR